MTKTIYIARSDRRHGDSFDLFATFDLAEARKAIEDGLDHLTAKEREQTTNHIDGYTVEILDGESAVDAYHRLLDEDELPSDPDYYDEPNEEATEECPVEFSAGPGRGTSNTVAYMLCNTDTGEELYAERDYNDYLWRVGIDADEYQDAEDKGLVGDLVDVLIPVLDYYIYPELRADIIEQAASLEIAEQILSFQFGESYYKPEDEQLAKIEKLWQGIKEEQIN